jgi:hypothetical protein
MASVPESDCGDHRRPSDQAKESDDAGPTMRTDTPTFGIFIVAFVIIFALLNFLAALSSDRSHNRSARTSSDRRRRYGPRVRIPRR